MNSCGLDIARFYGSKLSNHVHIVWNLIFLSHEGFCWIIQASLSALVRGHQMHCFIEYSIRYRIDLRTHHFGSSQVFGRVSLK